MEEKVRQRQFLSQMKRNRAYKKQKAEPRAAAGPIAVEKSQRSS